MVAETAAAAKVEEEKVEVAMAAAMVAEETEAEMAAAATAEEKAATQSVCRSPCSQFRMRKSHPRRTAQTTTQSRHPGKRRL